MRIRVLGGWFFVGFVGVGTKKGGFYKAYEII